MSANDELDERRPSIQLPEDDDESPKRQDGAQEGSEKRAAPERMRRDRNEHARQFECKIMKDKRSSGGRTIEDK
jgi:hypothetical protein